MFGVPGLSVSGCRMRCCLPQSSVADKEIKLSSRMSVLDVTWNVPIETGTEVEGREVASFW